MSKVFTPRRLDWLVRARGTDMARWPAADRAEALDLLKRSAAAQLAYAEALAREDAELDEVGEGDGATFARMQTALRRRLAPLPAALRGLGVGVLMACMAAGLYLAMSNSAEPDSAGDLFNSAQTVTFAALDQ